MSGWDAGWDVRLLLHNGETLTIAAQSVAAYDKEGAWIEGHKPD